MVWGDVHIWKFCTIVEVYTTSKKLVRSRVSMQFYGTLTFHDRSDDLLWWLSRRMWKENNERNYYVKYYSEITRLPDVINDLPSYLLTEVSINLMCFRQRSLRQVFSDIYSMLNAFSELQLKLQSTKKVFRPNWAFFFFIIASQATRKKIIKLINAIIIKREI